MRRICGALTAGSPLGSMLSCALTPARRTHMGERMSQTELYPHGLRKMTGRAVDESHRAASPLELLFDLVFVVAFGVAGNEFAHGIAEGHWLPALGGFCFAVAGIVWAWINYSWFASAFDTDDWLFRLLTMVQMAGVIVLAVGLPPMFASIEHGETFDNRVMVAGYVVMRVAMVLQWARAARDPRYRTVAKAYISAILVAQVGWVFVAIAPLQLGTAAVVALVLWAIELAGPMVAETKGAKHGGGATPWHPHHIAERYSLLAIVALGETVLGTLAAAQAISAAEGWSWDAIVVIGAGLAMTFALWWTYFLIPSATILAVNRHKAFAWGYGHAFVYAAIAGVGAGLHVVAYVFDDHYHVSTFAAILAIALPVLVFMVALYALHTWLVGEFSRNLPVQSLALVLPIIGVVLAGVGSPLWLCLLFVLAGPVAIVVSYELGAWRTLQTQVEKALHWAATR